MTLEYRKLTDAEVATEIVHTPLWNVANGKIGRTFEFHAYLDGPLFAVKVGHVAEELNHHPDIVIGYRKVRVEVNTHDVGGLSPYDFELAQRIDALV